MADGEYSNDWGVFEPSCGGVHVVPLFDIGEHVLNSECRCCPVVGEDGECVHNSFDGREGYESGRRLLN